MEYAKEVNIPDNNNDNVFGNTDNNEPLAEGDGNNDDEYASAACCAESIILLREGVATQD